MNETTEKIKNKGRGKETLFRVAYQHQGQLIQIADYKANMIISISTMIISGIIAIIGYGVVTGKGESYVPMLIVPVFLIVLTCLVSLIFAIMSARPKLITTGIDPVKSLKSSLLFFGRIATYTQEDYIRSMKELLLDEEQIYEQMTVDLYNQGLILKRKYDLLKMSYLLLMLGFIISVVSFAIAYMII